ncbi:MAG: aminomethyl-transferring glycine dehydrogenase subunit GcvPA [Kiritimatiellia bacterium]
MSYIAHTEGQRREMLKACGVSSIDELFADIPENLAPKSFNVPGPLSEGEVYNRFAGYAGRNYSNLTCFLGGGFYDHFIPAAVDAMAGRSEFYTAYTPYQPELSQGTLQAIYEYQTNMCRLLGMEVANASLYDGGTALCEACQLAIRSTGRSRIVMDSGVNPVYRTMVYTYTENLSIDFEEVPVVCGQSNRERIMDLLDDNTAAVILQNPNFFSVIDDHSDIVKHCHDKGILAIQSVYPVAMALLKSPGETGVDIAVGEGQALGIPMGFGGPYLGFMAVTRKLARRMPGRIVGRTQDRLGRESFVLTLQAREQHIRRDKASSNICTNEALCALRAHLYLSLLGKEGLKRVAGLCYTKAHYAKKRLDEVPGCEVMKTSPTFNEFTVRLPVNAGDLTGEMIERGIAPGLPLGRFYRGMDNYLLVAVTEQRTKYDIGIFAETMEEVLCH